jgi:hypothetical protein
MKKILMVLASVAILTTCISCGPKFEGTPYEHKLFSVTLPNGWNATEDGGFVILKKSESDILLLTSTDSNTDSAEKIRNDISNYEKNAVIEDARIGDNQYIKITAREKDNDVVRLILVRDNVVLMINASNFDGVDQQAILESLMLK